MKLIQSFGVPSMMTNHRQWRQLVVALVYLKDDFRAVV